MTINLLENEVCMFVCIRNQSTGGCVIARASPLVSLGGGHPVQSLLLRTTTLALHRDTGDSQTMEWNRDMCTS